MIYKDISNIITTHEINDVKGELFYVDFMYQPTGLTSQSTGLTRTQEEDFGEIELKVLSKYIQLEKIKIEDDLLVVDNSKTIKFKIPIGELSEEESKEVKKKLEEFKKDRPQAEQQMQELMADYHEDVQWDETMGSKDVPHSKDFWFPGSDPFMEENFLDEEYGNNPKLIKQLKRFIIDDVLENLENLANTKIQKNYNFWNKVKNFIYNVFGKNHIKKTNINFNNNKIFSKILMASNLIATDGRIGSANKCVVGGFIGSILQKSDNFNLEKNIKSDDLLPYLIGNINSIDVYIDPIKKFNDLSVLVYRINQTDQPGTKLVYQKDSTKFVLYDNINLETNYKVINTGVYPENQVNKIVFKNVSNG